MVTLSACLIVKNEIENIGRCLETILPVSDEIIIYDTGSNDGTQEFCKNYNHIIKVIQGEWKKDFGWARNQSFSYATSDYIFWVDADDIIDKKTQDWIIELKNRDFDGFDCLHLEYFYSAIDINNKGDFHFPRERILRRKLNFRWYDRVHEYINCQNCNDFFVSEDYAYIIHLKHEVSNRERNYEIFKTWNEEEPLIYGRHFYYFAKECKDNGKIDEAEYWFKRAKDSDKIWEIDRLNACLSLAQIYLEKNDINNALVSATRSIACTNTPRADVCVYMGCIYLEIGNYDWAKLWFEKAINNIPPNAMEGNFMDVAYYTWLPYLNLCEVEYNLGNIEMAKEYFYKAYEYEQTDEAIIKSKEKLGI